VDVALGSGANVYAMIDGTVIYKNEGGGGLSTISIYNSSLDKSIIYLHTNPLDSLAVGQHVDRGQHIADEAARGATASHTHVEMRPGYHQLAAKSVDDPVLDNPIPTTFWMNHGYNICCQ
jgi:murein DD-endopeptidase MepM/ murein hydrolase activator NlpD